MIIDDRRFLKKELSFYELEVGKIYVSHRQQKYLIVITDERYHYVASLESGEIFGEVDCDGDVFEPVKATLVVE